MINIKLNGTEQFIEQINLQQLIDQHITEQDNIAVAYNYTILPKENWQSTSLKDNDQIEIVHAIVGG